MNRRLLLLLPLVLLAPLSGPLLLHAAAQVEPEIKTAQKKLPMQDITITTQDGQAHLFHVEMATTMDQQTVGLMFRQSVPADGGMLFDWGRPRISQMWMRNTLVPLDMVFINQDGTIRHIAENTVPHSLAVIDSRGPARATLELAAGTTARLNINVGDKVRGAIFAKPAGG